MTGGASIVQAIRRHAAERPDAVAFAFSTDGATDDEHITYRELDTRARQIAARLANVGGAGERVLLLYPSGLDFVAALVGTFYAGMVAVPAVPPSSSKLDAHVARLQLLLRDTDAVAVLCTRAVDALVASRLTSRAAWIVTRELASTAPAVDAPVSSSSDALAMLQYTSGSTTAPRGVMLTHGNLEANLEMIRGSFDIDAASRVVSWLPLHHDMGLIGCVLGPATWGVPCVLMPPLRALARPVNWLAAISRHRATTSASPNFGYALAVRNVSDDERNQLDLSSWRVALNAAEPVREQTMRDFVSRFERCGFRADAFRPTYGLAEATVFVSTRHGVGVRSDNVSPQRHVSVGVAPAGTEILIVDVARMAAVRDGEVGEIWVRGPHVGSGYWQQPDSSATFRARTADGRGPYLRTGDLGFVAGGELYVTARIKDLLIVQGRNHAAEDVEHAAAHGLGADPRIAVAAFSVDTGAGSEEAVLVVELDRGASTGVEDLARRAAAIRVAVAEAHELSIHDITFVRAGTIPKTTSGKVQRNACRAAWLANTLDVVGRHPLATAAQAKPDMATRGMLRTRLLAMPAAARHRELQAYLLAELADLLAVRSSALDANQSLPALGIDSLKAVELRFRIEDELGIEFEIEAVAVTLTVAELATLVLDRLTGQQPSIVAAEPSASRDTAGDRRGVKLSLMFFSGDDNAEPAARYRLILDAAALADRHGFTAVWTPERHFHAFGGLFPNPATVGAALAVATRQIRIRAGSVVLPLHHPIRVAEEWSVVDNLSSGRVDLAFAAGRNARDFVLAPDAYAERSTLLLDRIRQVRQLWRGEPVRFHDGLGRGFDVAIHPPPVQREPGIWLTTSDSVDTFVAAGELGVNVLTGLVQQTPQELGEKIVAYRKSRAAARHAGDGEVTLMLQAYIGESDAGVRELVREPMISYLRSFLALWAGQDEQRRFATLDATAQEQMLRLGFERMFQARALFGTVERAAEIAGMYAGLGVTEIACLVDFGLPRERVLEGIERLAALRERVDASRAVST